MTYQLPVDLDNCAAQRGIATGIFLRVDTQAVFVSIVIITKETRRPFITFFYNLFRQADLFLSSAYDTFI